MEGEQRNGVRWGRGQGGVRAISSTIVQRYLLDIQGREHVLEHGGHELHVLLFALEVVEHELDTDGWSEYMGKDGRMDG